MSSVNLIRRRQGAGVANYLLLIIILVIICVCGIFFSDQMPKDFDSSRLAQRGPDGQHELQTDLGFFWHSQLITRPNSQTQPAVSMYGILLYNGTEFDLEQDDIGYISQNLGNDWRHNLEFIRGLRGDFVIVWVTDRYILMARDFGGNKCLWYSITGPKIKISNLESAVLAPGEASVRLQPNQCLILDRLSLQTIYDTKELFVFEHNPKVQHYDDVIDKFEHAVLKRWSPKIVIPLSAGMDSGAIAACLYHHDREFLAASRVGHEDEKILNLRHDCLTNADNFVFADVDKPALQTISRTISSLPLGQVGQVAAFIAQRIRSLGYRYVLSGNGGDELFSDYGWNGQRFHRASRFGGIFPDDTGKIWPWIHHDSQPLMQSIIIEDLVYGQHGIDTRNPMLDIDLIQAWLHLSTSLKNCHYKGWLQIYLKQRNFPFNLDKKPLPIPMDKRRWWFEKNLRKK